MAFQQGEVLLDKYRIEKQLGEGAFGEVYLAEHIQLGAKRALKVLRRDAPGMGSTIYKEYQERFRREAQLGARIDDPYVIRVYDLEKLGEVGDVLVMEYAPGDSLKKRLEKARKEKKPLDVQEALKITRDVALGLQALHALDVVHRDIKPSNIFISEGGKAMVGDLGLAQIPGGPSRRSAVGSLAESHPGTPAYMSPEQETTSNYLSPASDIFTLGVLLFELLTLRNYKSLKPGSRVSEFRKDIANPKPVEDLLAKMLTMNPKERIWNGEAAIRELDNFNVKPNPGSSSRGDKRKLYGGLLAVSCLLGLWFLFQPAGGEMDSPAQINVQPSAPYIEPSAAIQENVSAAPLPAQTEPPLPTNTPAPTETPLPTATATIPPTPIITNVPTEIYAPKLTYPCVSYYVGSGIGDLRLACNMAGSWQKEVVVSEGDVGRYNSLAFDFESDPHLSYFNETRHSLDYAYRKDGKWYIETVDSEGDVGWFTSLAFDLNWNPMISYFEKNKNHLKFAHRLDGVWHTEVIDEIGAPSLINYQAGIFSSLAVNRENHPIVAYDYEASRDLRFAEKVDGKWVIEEVDTMGEVGRHCSLALDYTGNPAISYYDSDNISLKYAERSGNGWDIQVAEGYGFREVGVFSSLAFRRDDTPAIGYFDESWDDLRFATISNGYWVQEAIDVNGHTGGYSSLALDAYDVPYLACFFWDGGALRVWHKGKEKWEMEEVDTYSASDKQVGLHVKIRFVPVY